MTNDTIMTDTNLEMTKDIHPIATSFHSKLAHIRGIDIPRYANTKFSEINPAVSIKNSIVILPHGLNE